MARTKQTARKQVAARQRPDGDAAAGEEQAHGRKLMLAGRSGQVREVFADGSLGPIEKRKKGPGGVPPPVASGKYKQCSSEELLQKIEHFRAQLELLESKRMNRDAQNKQHPIKLPKKSKIQLRMARKELRELQRELKARAAPADQKLPSGGGAGGGAGEDAALGASSSDEEDDDEEEGDDE